MNQHEWCLTCLVVPEPRQSAFKKKEQIYDDLLILPIKFWVILSVKNCEVFLCFLAIIFLGSIVSRHLSGFFVLIVFCHSWVLQVFTPTRSPNSNILEQASFIHNVTRVIVTMWRSQTFIHKTINLGLETPQPWCDCKTTRAELLKACLALTIG